MGISVSRFLSIEKMIEEVTKLLPDERQEAIGEIAAFCLGYREAKDEPFADRSSPEVLPS